VLAVRNYCYDAVCSAAHGASARMALRRPRWRRGAGHIVAAAHYSLLMRVLGVTAGEKLTFLDIHMCILEHLILYTF